MDNQLQHPNLSGIFADFNAKIPPDAYQYTGLQIAGINKLRIDIIKQKVATALTGDPIKDCAEDAYLRGQLTILDYLLDLHNLSINPVVETE